MDAAYKSLAMLDAPGSLEKIALPLMMLAAEEDGLVDIRAIRRAADRLPECRLHSYGPNAAHEILREADDVRLDALARIDAFLNEVAPALRSEEHKSELQSLMRNSYAVFCLK